MSDTLKSTLGTTLPGSFSDIFLTREEVINSSRWWARLICIALAGMTLCSCFLVLTLVAHHQSLIFKEDTHCRFAFLTNFYLHFLGGVVVLLVACKNMPSFGIKGTSTPQPLNAPAPQPLNPSAPQPQALSTPLDPSNPVVPKVLTPPSSFMLSSSFEIISTFAAQTTLALALFLGQSLLCSDSLQTMLSFLLILQIIQFLFQLGLSIGHLSKVTWPLRRNPSTPQPLNPSTPLNFNTSFALTETRSVVIDRSRKRLDLSGFTDFSALNSRDFDATKLVSTLSADSGLNAFRLKAVYSPRRKHFDEVEPNEI